MEKEFKQLSGLSLLVGSFIIVTTMVLHPSGGDIDHILRIKSVLMGSHSLAIISIPFVAFGFWGLSIALLTKSRASMLAFMVSCVGVFAAMIAGTINGLTLPMFLTSVSKNSDVNITNAIVSYGRNINIPMDYIFILSFSLSILIWSILIIRNSTFPKWLGYYGLIIIFSGVLFSFSYHSLVDLLGFRVVVFAGVSWMILAGARLSMKPNDKTSSVEQ